MSEQERCSVVVRSNGLLTHKTLGAHLSPAAGPDVQLDLSDLSFIDPAGLVTVATVAERAVAAGSSVSVSGPRDPDVANYVRRMRLGSIFDELGIMHALPAVSENALGARLVELERFHGSDGLETVVRALVTTFLSDRPRTVQPLYTALQETAENVVQHSGMQHGYAALQRLTNSGRVKFAIGDSGVGLRHRLSAALTVVDDRMAIVRAARMHETSTGLPGRGRGINRVIEVTGQHQGDVTLFTGRASGRFSGGNPDPQLSCLPVAMPGTLAHVRLSL